MAILLLVGAVIAVDALDVQIRPEPMIPAAPYAFSMLVAAYFLRPRRVAAVAAMSMATHLLVAWLHAYDPLALAIDQAALLFIAAMSTILAARIRADAMKSETEASLARLQAVVEGMIEGVIILDSDGRILTVNPATLQLYGLHSPDQVVGRNWDDLASVLEFRCLDGGPVPLHEWPAARILRGETVSDLELEVRRIDSGVTSIARYNGRLVRMRGDKSTLGLLTEHGITSDRRMAALRDSEEMFRMIAANSPDTVFHQDRDLRYTWIINPTPPFTTDEALGRSDFDLLSEEEARRLTDIKKQVMESGIGARCEMRVAHGEVPRCYDICIEAWRDRNGEIDGVTGYGRDVTNQRRAQAQLLEQQRSLAILEERGRIARELHDSLAQVLSYVATEGQAVRELLARGDASTADGYLEQLVEAAREAVVDVRDFVGGVQSATRAGFLVAVEEQLRRLADSHGIRTELAVPPDLSADAFAYCVQTQLLRIIQEALINVRKHSEATAVAVEFAVQNGQLQVIVQDDGRGFDPHRPRADGAQTFGLLVMRERALEVGGDLQVLSTPGQGTRLEVHVPSATRGSVCRDCRRCVPLQLPPVEMKDV